MAIVPAQRHDGFCFALARGGPGRATWVDKGANDRMAGAGGARAGLTPSARSRSGSSSRGSPGRPTSARSARAASAPPTCCAPAARASPPRRLSATCSRAPPPSRSPPRCSVAIERLAALTVRHAMPDVAAPSRCWSARRLPRRPLRPFATCYVLGVCHGWWSYELRTEIS